MQPTWRSTEHGDGPWMQTGVARPEARSRRARAGAGLRCAWRALRARPTPRLPARFPLKLLSVLKVRPREQMAEGRVSSQWCLRYLLGAGKLLGGPWRAGQSQKSPEARRPGCNVDIDMITLPRGGPTLRQVFCFENKQILSLAAPNGTNSGFQAWSKCLPCWTKAPGGWDSGREVASRALERRYYHTPAASF